MEQIFADNPLKKLSPFLNIKANYLIEIGNDILKMLPKKNEIEFNHFLKTYGYVSLWIFGTYEFIRTTDQYKEKTFKKKLQREIKKFKKQIDTIRITLAKQELPDKKGHMTMEGQSISSITNGDYQFQFKNKPISFKDLLLKFTKLIQLISDEKNNI